MMHAFSPSGLGFGGSRKRSFAIVAQRDSEVQACHVNSWVGSCSYPSI